MSPGLLDLDSYRLELLAPASAVAGRGRKVRRGRFIMGPIALSWAAAAGRLPGRALQVAVMLFYLRGLEKADQLTVPTKLAREFGVDRHAEKRALIAMEQAGLIKVEFGRGRRPRITLVLPEE